MLTAAFVGKCVTDFVGQPNLRRFKVRFATRVWPGDTITCKGRVTKKYAHDGEKRIDGEVVAVNQKGELAVTGTFTAALPSRG
jgi:acyl dehydratase